MGNFWNQTCWLDWLNSGWLQLCPHRQMKRLHRGAAETELQVWNTHLLCIWAWVNSIIISEAVITCPSICRAMVGPPCFRQQVQLTIWQLTPMEGVIQTSWGRVDPRRAFRQSEPKPTNQQTSEPGREWKQHRGGGGDWAGEWRMAVLCFHLQELDRLSFLLHGSRCQNGFFCLCFS